jgi:hypothetical protein
MIDLNLLKRTLILGVILQLALVACGYFWPWFRPRLLFSVMLTSGVAGMLYARELARGFKAGMLGGALAGAGTGLAAVLSAAYLDERPDIFLPYGAMVTMLTGTAGGLFGELDARLRAYIIRKLS